MNGRAKRGWVLLELSVCITDELRRAGFSPKRAEELAQRAVTTWISNVGGSEIYIPQSWPGALAQRDHAIATAFTGDNVERLASQYGLTPRRIRQIASARKSA